MAHIPASHRSLRAGFFRLPPSKMREGCDDNVCLADSLDFMDCPDFLILLRNCPGSLPFSNMECCFCPWRRFRCWCLNFDVGNLAEHLLHLLDDRGTLGKCREEQNDGVITLQVDGEVGFFNLRALWFRWLGDCCGIWLG